MTGKNPKEKYQRGYFPAPEPSKGWVDREYIDKAPAWCSVDLRDGNQALVIPMSLEEKLRFWDILIKIGFKEIEIGFPAASETEYAFCRALIENNLIPEDVTIQVLTQSREHIIDKTFDAVQGAKNVVVHLYNSTSVAQREQVFKKSKEEIIDIAVFGAKLLLEKARGIPGVAFEYSPESFTGTEPAFALDICRQVLNVWSADSSVADRKIIINLPVTVELSLPHIYASQVEYMCGHLRRVNPRVIVSLHPHNDRGCAVADTELGLLAGADRVEGTLFGNGERTGNADIVTLAMNMFSHGVDPGLDFSFLPEIRTLYESLSGLKVSERHPYAGDLVFAAFSGSHQDAIAKGMEWREQKNLALWSVPYLPIDPRDVGRQYDGDVIRINSQSGKGGIAWILEKKCGLYLPKSLREQAGYIIKDASDKQHQELLPDEVLAVFNKEYVNITLPIKFIEAHYVQENDGTITATVTIQQKGAGRTLFGYGNGRLDAAAGAISASLGVKLDIVDYSEHSLERGSKASAIAYVEVTRSDSTETFWGAGIHTDTVTASIRAFVSAVNRLLLLKDV